MTAHFSRALPEGKARRRLRQPAYAGGPGGDQPVLRASRRTRSNDPQSTGVTLRGNCAGPRRAERKEVGPERPTSFREFHVPGANSATDDDVARAKHTGARVDDRARVISQRERVQVRSRSDTEIGDGEHIRDRLSVVQSSAGGRGLRDAQVECRSAVLHRRVEVDVPVRIAVTELMIVVALVEVEVASVPTLLVLDLAAALVLLPGGTQRWPLGRPAGDDVGQSGGSVLHHDAEGSREGVEGLVDRTEPVVKPLGLV